MTFESKVGDEFRHHAGMNPKRSHCTFDGVQWTFTAQWQPGLLSICTRTHPGDSSEYKPVKPDLTDDDVRGEFGMPTLGGGFGMIGAGMLTYPRQTGKTFVSEKVERICNIFDEAQTLYKRKAAGYAGVEGDLANHLGVKGQFVDINRKFWKIKAMLWDEVVPMYPDAGAGEDIEEILMDVIGHAALTIDFLRQSQGEKEDGS